MRSPDDFPADIEAMPEDILEAASDLLGGFGYPISHLDIPDLIPVVASALMERDRAATERAAKIAEEWPMFPFAQRIAAAIRSQP
jgi:hypothetical protein